VTPTPGKKRLSLASDGLNVFVQLLRKSVLKRSLFMHPKKFALFAGVMLVLAGVLAFIPSLSTVNDTLIPLKVDASYGYFLGFIPMNVVSKIALILIGLLGIAASMAPATNLPKSIAWNRLALFAGMGVLSVLGMFPQTNTLFGYWPLYGHYIWVHGLMSLMGAYFGFALTARAEKPTDANLAKNQAMAGYPS
jgi:Domain of unknown function (DUF4383)